VVAKSSTERKLSDRIQKFFQSQGIDNTVRSIRLTKGSRRDTGTHHEDIRGLVGTNAVAGLAATDRKRAKKFTEALWNTPIPSGQNRYYEACFT